MSTVVLVLIIVLLFFLATILAVAVGLMCVASRADREAQRWLNGERHE